MIIRNKLVLMQSTVLKMKKNFANFLAALNAKRKELDARKDELKKEEQCHIMANAFNKCEGILNKAADDAFDSFNAYGENHVYITIPLEAVLNRLSDVGAVVRLPERVRSDDYDKERFLTVWLDALDFEKMKLDGDDDLMIPGY